MDKDFLQVLAGILNAYCSVARDEVQLVFENCIVNEITDNTTLFHEKRFNAFEYFQLEGVSRRYNADGSGRQTTTGIYQGATVITPHFAHTRNGESIFTLQALTECTFLKVPSGAFRDLMDQNPQIRRFGQAVVEREFITSLNFEVLFRSHSAEDRLLYFRDRYPALENTIPHTVIASFLGITPVSFSRLRNELAKK